MWLLIMLYDHQKLQHRFDQALAEVRVEVLEGDAASDVSTFACKLRIKSVVDCSFLLLDELLESR